MQKLSEAQRRALRKLAVDTRSSPYECRVPYTTFAALERRGLISVETTLGAFAFPQDASAVITPAGRAALEGSEK